MQSIYNTIAGKWLIDNVDQLNTKNIPAKVLVSLASFSEEGLYVLADEIVWNKIWLIFEKFKGIDSEDTTVRIDDDELDKFFEDYRKKLFPSFKSCEDLVDYFINKMVFMLDIVVSWSQGFVKLSNHIDFWEFIEQKAKTKHLKKKDKTKTCWTPENCAKILSHEQSYKQTVKAMLKNKKYEEASLLVKEYREYIERKIHGNQSAG